jgi:hypothetical protein
MGLSLFSTVPTVQFLQVSEIFDPSSVIFHIHLHRSCVQLVVHNFCKIQPVVVHHIKIDIRATVKHNKILRVLSIHATSFDPTNHPQKLKPVKITTSNMFRKTGTHTIKKPQTEV